VGASQAVRECRFYRAPGYWLAGVLGGFFVVMLAGLALFIVVAIPVGVIDILSNDCDGGFLALGGRTYLKVVADWRTRWRTRPH
jgi:hypothetical protein